MTGEANGCRHGGARYQRPRASVNPLLDKMYPKRESTAREQHSQLQRLVARLDFRGAVARLVIS